MGHSPGAIKLTPKQTGGFSARKRIPQDVRVEYERLYGNSSEEWFSIGPTDGAEARCKAQEWNAEIETRIINIRSGRKGGAGLALSRTQAAALAGEWYRWFIAKHEEAPGETARWEARELTLTDDIESLAPKSVLANPDGEALWHWAQSDDARPIVRPVVADAAQTAQFLASQGLTLSADAQGLFLDSVQAEFFAAVRLLGRRAANDYSIDERPKRFPKFTRISMSEM